MYTIIYYVYIYILFCYMNENTNLSFQGRVDPKAVRPVSASSQNLRPELRRIRRKLRKRTSRNRQLEIEKILK